MEKMTDLNKLDGIAENLLERIHKSRESRAASLSDEGSNHGIFDYNDNRKPSKSIMKKGKSPAKEGRKVSMNASTMVWEVDNDYASPIKHVFNRDAGYFPNTSDNEPVQVAKVIGKVSNDRESGVSKNPNPSPNVNANATDFDKDGRSAYARALIEILVDDVLKEDLVIVIPFGKDKVVTLAVVTNVELNLSKNVADDGFEVVKKKRNKKKKYQKQVDGVVLNKPSLNLHYPRVDKDDSFKNVAPKSTGNVTSTSSVPTTTSTIGSVASATKSK
nr:hypothetical protein [Tanacetum cinerariifolium]